MWKGCLLWKVYMPSKRARFVIKLFELCEAKSGYVWNLIIYFGQGTVFNESLKWPKSSATTNGSSTESGLLCNHGQLVFNPRSRSNKWLRNV
jgi:hypothetical protein